MKEPTDTLDVIFTVDVENGRGNVPYGIEGELSEFGIKENCGINYIIDTFSVYNAKAVFFVNVYEHALYDPEYMPSLLRRISQRGHEVALHAHTPPRLLNLPFWTKSIVDCSLEEQKQIFAYGKDYIFQATGKFPVSYRSGAYWANDSIFEALHDTGFKVDSSVYYMHPHNRFKEYANRKNQIFQANGIIEFPVVVIWNGHKWMKLDINWLTEDELICAFEMMRKSRDYHAVQCMFHSFSFFNGSDVFKAINARKNFVCKEKKIEKKKLENLLKFLRSSDKYRILTFEEYLKEEYAEDDILYLANRELAVRYLAVEVLYDENVLTLVNHFKGDEIQYAYYFRPVEGKGQGPKYDSEYQSNNTYRIELNKDSDGIYYVKAYVKHKDEQGVSVMPYNVKISHGKVLSVERR